MIALYGQGISNAYKYRIFTRKRPIQWAVSIGFGLLLVAAYCLLLPTTTHAFVSMTGGDGYVPIVYQDKIFNIYHHQSPSSDPNQPKYDINCFIRANGERCATYPRYFSSTVSSSGRPGVGTPGITDIHTTYYPQAVIEGSRLFYAAQRTSDNGIGCFDVASGTNCGYTQLGSLAWSGASGFPGLVDGVERLGNRVYSVGADMQMYCLDITNAAASVPCSGQPYLFNNGITAQLPVYNGARFGVLRQVLNDRIYLAINYSSHSPAANARVTCFDTTTNTRCAGWSSLEALNTLALNTRSFFEYPDSSGASTALCVAQLITNPVQCWNLVTMMPTAGPPNLFSGIIAHSSTWAWEDLHDGNRTYFALSAGANDHNGMVVCYDFTIQARCSGFGANGVKVWDGSDGGEAIHGGDTRDYGYALFQSCMYGLGDAGVLWSFDKASGAVPGNPTCALQGGHVLGAFTSVPSVLGASTAKGSVLGASTLGLPNAGMGPAETQSAWWTIPAGAATMFILYVARKKYRNPI